MEVVGIDSRETGPLVILLSDNLNTVCGNQNINLPERLLETFFELFEESLRDPIVSGDDFDLDNLIDIFYAAVLPSSLVR